MHGDAPVTQQFNGNNQGRKQAHPLGALFARKTRSNSVADPQQPWLASHVPATNRSNHEPPPSDENPYLSHFLYQQRRDRTVILPRILARGLDKQLPLETAHSVREIMEALLHPLCNRRDVRNGQVPADVGEIVHQRRASMSGREEMLDGSEPCLLVEPDLYDSLDKESVGGQIMENLF